MSKTEELRAQFITVILCMTRAQRLTCAEDIKTLSAYFEINEDLTADRRSMSWKPGGKARNTIDNKKTHRISWRYTGDSYNVTLGEAAKELGMKKQSLANHISQGKGKYHRTIELSNMTDIVTVTKIV